MGFQRVEKPAGRPGRPNLATGGERGGICPEPVPAMTVLALPSLAHHHARLFRDLGRGGVGIAPAAEQLQGGADEALLREVGCWGHRSRI